METHIYNVCYNCNECNGWHATSNRVRFTSSELDGQSVVMAYAGQELPSSVKVIQEPNKLHCPSMNTATSQPDPNKIFLSLAT
jgi:hypothetical protein